MRSIIVRLLRAIFAMAIPVILQTTPLSDISRSGQESSFVIKTMTICTFNGHQNLASVIWLILMIGDNRYQLV
jgi:hypothetical protein